VLFSTVNSPIVSEVLSSENGWNFFVMGGVQIDQ
jgi:hypothetical protein